MLSLIRRWRDPWERAFNALPPGQATREDLVLDETAVRRDLEQTGIPLHSYHINVDAFRLWRAEASYETRHSGYYTGNLEEKSLEHFVAADIARPARGQVLIDVASQTAVAGEVYSRLYGAEVYRQDLDYRRGLHGREIGGDAARMEIPDEFADILTLHCSFEHFEGGSDSGFIREAGRVLRPGGVCVIAPLYLCQHYACLTHPPLSAGRGVPFEPEMRIHALRHWVNRFGRFYSAEKFMERVWTHRGELEGEVLLVENGREVSPSIYLRYILVLRKPAKP